MTVTIILFTFYFKPKVLLKINIPQDKRTLSLFLTVIMVVNIAQVGARLGDPAQTNWQFYSAANRLLAALALVISLTYFVQKIPISVVKYRFVTLIAAATLIRLFSIISAPNPTIDVFYILRNGPKLLLEGKNPYELSYPAPYGVYIPTILFIYGPLAAFLFAPSVLIFNDPRFMLILADLISAFLIVKIARLQIVASQMAQIIVIIFLFHPLFAFMTEQAWLEPLVTLFFFLATYLFLKYPKKSYGSIFLGAVLAIKSVYLLPVATYLKNKRASLTQYLTAILIPLILSFAFLIRDWRLFLDRTQVYVTTPESIQANLAPTHIALNISAIILKYTDIVLPTIIVGLIGLATTLLLILRGSRQMPYVVLSTFLIFMVLFMFGPFVFVHYFAFLGNLLILTLLLFLGKTQKV